MSQSTNDAATDDTAQPLSLSDAYRVLASSRRKHVLEVLATDEPPVALDALGAAVARLEADSAVADSAAGRRVAVDLHHSHLPMLDELGIVTYDESNNRVVAYHQVSSVALRQAES